MKTNDGRYWRDTVLMLASEKNDEKDERVDNAESGEDLVPDSKKVRFSIHK